RRKCNHCVPCHDRRRCAHAVHRPELAKSSRADSPAHGNAGVAILSGRWSEGISVALYSEIGSSRQSAVGGVNAGLKTLCLSSLRPCALAMRIENVDDELPLIPDKTSTLSLPNVNTYARKHVNTLPPPALTPKGVRRAPPHSSYYVPVGLTHGN